VGDTRDTEGVHNKWWRKKGGRTSFGPAYRKSRNLDDSLYLVP